MFIPLAEALHVVMGGGEERHYFYFYQRDPNLPVEMVITRLPPFFDPEKNWHRHNFVEEFSVPLIGEIEVREKTDKETKKIIQNRAILKKNEWVVGIDCKSPKESILVIESTRGKVRKEIVKLLPEFTEGRNLHTVGNPTNNLVTFLTIKRAPRKIFKKDPLVFQIDREPNLNKAIIR